MKYEILIKMMILGFSTAITRTGIGLIGYGILAGQYTLKELRSLKAETFTQEESQNV